MKYNIQINQKAIYDLGLVGKIKANHIAIMEVIVGLYASAKSSKINDQSGMWVLANPSLIVKQLPMFEISESRCRQLIVDLAECELIEKNPGNIFLQGTYLRPGRLYEGYQNFDNVPKKQTDVVKKLTGGYQKIDNVPCQKIDTSIIGNNTISDNSISNNNNDSENVAETPEDIFKSYADKLKDDTLSIERMALATKVFKPGEVPELLESFYLMLLANERHPHKNYSEFRSHFFNWIGRHKEKQPTEQRKAQRETEQNDIERRRQLAREQKYGL